jgi:osmotically-inducible protein OsmY
MKIRRKNNFIKLAFFSLLISIICLPLQAQTENHELKKNVEKAIGNYYDEIFRINVSSHGVVTVEGEVNTLYDKLKIGELIEEVDGVQKINNNISIMNEITADDIIKANIEDELERNDAIAEPDKINVEVRKGIVTLSGHVNYFREKVLAQSIASWQDGVTDMISKIVVLPPLVAKSDENIAEIINDLIKRHFSLETKVKFSVDDGKVNLNGTVSNLWAKDHIQKEIQNILGVKEVINNLSLEHGEA